MGGSERGGSSTQEYIVTLRYNFRRHIPLASQAITNLKPYLGRVHDRQPRYVQLNNERFHAFNCKRCRAHVQRNWLHISFHCDATDEPGTCHQWKQVGIRFGQLDTAREACFVLCCASIVHLCTFRQESKTIRSICLQEMKDAGREVERFGDRCNLDGYILADDDCARNHLKLHGKTLLQAREQQQTQNATHTDDRRLGWSSFAWSQHLGQDKYDVYRSREVLSNALGRMAWAKLAWAKVATEYVRTHI